MGRCARGRAGAGEEEGEEGRRLSVAAANAPGELAGVPIPPLGVASSSSSSADVAQLRSERARKGAETRKAKLKAKEDRQRRAAEKRAAAAAAADADKAERKPRAVDDARDDAPEAEEWERWVRTEMERPLQGPDDLAEFLGKVQMTLCGVAAGTPFEDAAWSLQWTNGKDALRRCKIGARCLWPWMKKNGLDGVVLAEQAEGILALVGVVVLVGPTLRPAIQAMHKVRAGRAQGAAAAAGEQTIPLENQQKREAA